MHSHLGFLRPWLAFIHFENNCLSHSVKSSSSLCPIIKWKRFFFLINLLSGRWFSKLTCICSFQDARKGVLFIDFPPVLQLQLKRFEYDFMRDTMVKVSDLNNFFPHRL